ncbi:uncharacterized protein MYCGRDRAFT_92841 [Zymoseptoria tritici IPO323]|uniref:Uncharacterized protein n=1 Tax=Zymoseptoria tritici (strain CBS 115943 / IPO323) TaxID=336722 RepID=F9X8M0_ZYMTI|nr:uncharacterized protein MYCGRDRAFT_92841 [Zymoseptoria tritici IPO323]EGP88219.1 hypothetical protein MYCGRDRAFT_92841 [Zymoseptoria tritici IPO323]
MASPAFAVLNCGGYCECLEADGGHCCVDITYGAERNGGFATKSGDDCTARRSIRQAYDHHGKEHRGSSSRSSLSGQLRYEWTHGDGGKEAETKVKPVDKLSTNRASLMLVEIIVLWLPDGHSLKAKHSIHRSMLHHILRPFLSTRTSPPVTF